MIAKINKIFGFISWISCFNTSFSFLQDMFIEFSDMRLHTNNCIIFLFRKWLPKLTENLVQKGKISNKEWTTIQIQTLSTNHLTKISELGQQPSAMIPLCSDISFILKTVLWPLIKCSNISMITKYHKYSPWNHNKIRTNHDDIHQAIKARVFIQMKGWLIILKEEMARNGC